MPVFYAVKAMRIRYFDDVYAHARTRSAAMQHDASAAATDMLFMRSVRRMLRKVRRSAVRQRLRTR